MSTDAIHHIIVEDLSTILFEIYRPHVVINHEKGCEYSSIYVLNTNNWAEIGKQPRHLVINCSKFTNDEIYPSREDITIPLIDPKSLPRYIAAVHKDIMRHFSELAANLRGMVQYNEKLNATLDNLWITIALLDSRYLSYMVNNKYIDPNTYDKFSDSSWRARKQTRQINVSSQQTFAASP